MGGCKGVLGGFQGCQGVSKCLFQVQVVSTWLLGGSDRLYGCFLVVLRVFNCCKGVSMRLLGCSEWSQGCQGVFLRSLESSELLPGCCFQFCWLTWCYGWCQGCLDVSKGSFQVQGDGVAMML